MTDLLPRTRASILVTEEQKEELHAVAADCGMSFAAWAREVLLAAAGASPLRGQMETALEYRERLQKERKGRKKRADKVKRLARRRSA